MPAPGAPTARIFATGLYLRQSFWSTSGMRPVILETDGRSVRLTNAEGEVFCVPGPQVSVTFKARFMILNVKGEEFQLFPRGDIASPPFTPGMVQYLDAHGGRRAMGGGTATGAMLGSAIIPGMGLATLVGTYQSLITPWKSVFPSLGVRFV